MKKILPFIILLLLQDIFAQNLVGKWGINFLIDNERFPPKEYILTPTKLDKNNIEFGQMLILKPDGTFKSYRIPGCGQDISPPSTYGKYTIIDENYISFFLEKRYEGQETIINKDLGKFYYSKKDDGFKLLKSSGNIEHDKQTAYFRDLLYDKNIEINEFEGNVLNWKYTTEHKDDKEAVSFCLSESQLGNFEILYSRHVEGYNRTIILIKIESDYKYIVFEKNVRRKGLNRIALYDDSKIKEIDKLVAEIKNEKKLKTKTIKDNNEAKQNSNNNSETILDLFQKKKEIKKAVYNTYISHSKNQSSINNITIYFQEEKPIYVEYLTKHISNQQEQESITGFYILDFKNHKYITKTIKKDNGKKDYPSGLINKAMDNIKSYLK